MFFLTYLRRELRRRIRQSVVIALGLALGVGLVIAVTAASAGVRNAQASVLKGLYGVGTDVTVTKKPAPPKGRPGGGTRIQIGPGGGTVCNGSKCHTGAQKVDNLTSPGSGILPASVVAKIARLRDVAGAAGGLVLTDTQLTIPASIGSAGGGTLPQPKSFDVDGVDLGHPALGPLSAGTISAGRNLAAADARANVAVVDSSYAIANKIKTGSTITIAKTRFTVVGIVRQPQGGSAPDVYIPLVRAQALATGPAGKGHLRNEVTTVYVAARSAADIASVRSQISALLPSATVTTSSSLASQVTGSLASAGRLASDLGRWLSVLVLIAAFAVASLLMMAAVARRVREFGTLKALGWRSRRIVAQVMGESLAMGVIGAAAGVALGLGGAALITALAPKLTATLASPTAMRFFSAGPAGTSGSSPSATHSVAVPMIASASAGAIVVAALLAIAGGLIAGTLGSWRIGQLRPAAALARVE
ncbi:MAG TPA: ABC transporter permease [Streptosporangiaceae bacterium]|nr:ABC transporter permease [Streptosporangiaceae bacterium]